MTSMTPATGRDEHPQRLSLLDAFYLPDLGHLGDALIEAVEGLAGAAMAQAGSG
jgi:hypothetical protein